VSSKPPTDRPLHAGELARLAGVSPDTVRFYERRHLLPAAPRSESGYRVFPPEALTRVQLIRGALSIGFTISELAAIFGERDRGGAPCHKVRKLAAEKLAALEAQLRDLRAWRRELRRTLAEWDRLLVKTPRGKQARLLDAFAATHPKNHTRRSALSFLASGSRKQERQT
jgi:DNA-binding transcriptional MerR regulator